MSSYEHVELSVRNTDRSLEYCSNEYPGIAVDDRSSRFDVFFRDMNRDGFLIETQNWSQKSFNKRAVYYSSFDDCLSLKDLWIYSIKNMASQNEFPEKVVGTDLDSLFNMAELAKMRPDERIAYQMSMIHRVEYLNSRQEVIEEATKEGHKEGLEQGINHAIVQMSKS